MVDRRTKRLFDKATQSPNNYSLSDMTALLRGLGFQFERQKGSHMIFSHPGDRRLINIQEMSGGQVKPYQVKQALSRIEELGLLEE